MQELRLESGMVKGIENAGQKDRRDDAECFFETHAKKTVDKQHLEDAGSEYICRRIQIFLLQKHCSLGDPISHEHGQKPRSKKDIQNKTQFDLPIRKADIREDRFPLLIYIHRYENDAQSEDHDHIPKEKRHDRIPHRISRERQHQKAQTDHQKPCNNGHPSIPCHFHLK